MGVKVGPSHDRISKVFGNGVLKKVFGISRKERQGGGIHSMGRIFMICTSHQILFG